MGVMGMNVSPIMIDLGNKGCEPVFVCGLHKAPLTFSYNYSNCNVPNLLLPSSQRCRIELGLINRIPLLHNMNLC